MTVRAVLLDLFGTLIAYGDMAAGTRVAWEGVYAVIVELGARSRRPVPEYAAFVPPWEANMRVLAARQDGVAAGPGGATPFVSKLLRFFRSLGLPEDPDAALRAAEACLAGWDAYLELPDDTLPALEALRGRYRLALVSNFDHPPYARRLLDRLGLSARLDCITISGELWIDKPDPRIFHAALAALGAPAAAAVHVGDELRSDIAGAQAAGVRPILIDRSGRHGDYAAGPRIISLAELAGVLEGLG
ncbi:MAG: HAD family hydrolase [Chloroflexota bacterium]